MLSTVGRFSYTKYWDILYVQHCVKIYLNKILGYAFYWKLLEDLFTKIIQGILSVEHCWKIYLHKILGNTFYWTLLEDLFTQKMGNTLCWTLLKDLFTQNTRKYFLLNMVGRFIYTKYWEILYVEHC